MTVHRLAHTFPFRPIASWGNRGQHSHCVAPNRPELPPCPLLPPRSAMRSLTQLRGDCLTHWGCILKSRQPADAGGASNTAFEGKEKRLSLGTFPDTSLAEARDNRDAARKLLAKRIDPSAQRKADKRAEVLRDSNSFAAVALEWHGKQAGTWTARHAADVLRRLNSNLIPDLGARPIAADYGAGVACGGAQGREPRRARLGASHRGGCRPSIPLRRSNRALRARPIGRPARRAHPAQAAQSVGNQA